MALPYAWGERDCIMVVADWVARWTGRDPAEDLRMAYGTAGECQRVTRFFTNPLTAIGPRMAFLPETKEPRPGDALLCTDGVRPFGAICLGMHLAAFVEGRGVLVKRMDGVKVLRAWEVPVDE